MTTRQDPTALDPRARKQADEEFAAKRRGRNWALMAVLLAMVALFYFITIARIAVNT